MSSRHVSAKRWQDLNPELSVVHSGVVLRVVQSDGTIGAVLGGILLHERVEYGESVSSVYECVHWVVIRRRRVSCRQ